MAKKSNKLMLLGVLATTVAAGAYYYLKSKNKDSLNEIDDFEDFEDFDDDFEDDFDDNSNTSDKTKNRSYVSLDLDNAKEKIGEKVIETIDKTKDKIEQFNVSEKLDKAKEKIEELTAPPKPSVSSTYVDDYVTDTVTLDNADYTTLSAENNIAKEADINKTEEKAVTVNDVFFDDTKEEL